MKGCLLKKMLAVIVVMAAGAVGVAAAENAAGASSEKPLVKFLFMADHHIESDFLEKRGDKMVPVYETWKPGNHAALVKTYEFINNDPFCRDCAFALFAGDQLNTGYSRTPKEMADEKANYSRTLKALNLHTQTRGQTADMDFTAMPWTVRENLARGQKPYTVTPQPPQSRVIAIQGNHDTGVDEFYRDCAFTVGGVRFITFFAAYVGLTPPPGVKFHSTAKISDASLAFIETEMKKAAANPQIKQCVLVSHWAIADAGKDFHHPIIGPCKENGRNDNRARLLEIAEKYHCHLFINGHEHNSRYPVGKVGNLSDINCGSTASVNAGFAIVEIFPRRAVFHVYSRADNNGAMPKKVFTREIVH